MICFVSLKSGAMCFSIGKVYFERSVASALTKINRVLSYNKRTSEIKMELQYFNGSMDVEVFSLKEELGLLNYPNFVSIANSVKGVVLA